MDHSLTMFLKNNRFMFENIPHFKKYTILDNRCVIVHTNF